MSVLPEQVDMPQDPISTPPWHQVKIKRKRRPK